ncbi:MAG: polysaccharide deacetylase family protein [Lentisphaeria bacterium]|nr:polysaccharide deacetylase family protein [Lentisphaeria bacterium]
MRETIFPLWNDSDIESNLTVCEFPENDSVRPAILVVPGGGYGGVCRSTEGDPIAARFAGLGFRTFILHYRVAPNRFPIPQQDILRAIRMIRYNAEAWRIYPDQLAVCGFSAGGHLCASSGIIPDDVENYSDDVIDKMPGRPNAMLLAYPVITSGKYAHKGSFQNLLGKDYAKRKREFSLETRVTKESAPAFIWHTVEDQAVPVENSYLLSEAMRKNGVVHELHIFPCGPHGMQLGYGRADIAQWPEQAAAFLYGTLGFTRADRPEKPRTVVLTFDDACKSHLENVAPILKKYGFNATFFICRFNDEWRKKNQKHLLTGKEIKELSDMGFEIGNHTWNHPDLKTLSEAEISEEIGKLNDFFAENGIPKPVSFAYPGGPFAENAVPVLKKHGLIAARTTEQVPWNLKKHDLMQTPSFPLQKNSPHAFYFSLGGADANNVPVLLFHGVPDLVHEWVDTAPEFFAKCMKYLYDNDYRVISMKQYLEENGLC